MKKLLFTSIILTLVLVAMPAITHGTPDPATVTIAGSFQSELGCPGDWQPDCSSTFLTYNSEYDVWQDTFSVPAGNWEYKAALNSSWDENYGANATPSGPNINLSLSNPEDVTFYYDHKSHWITDNVNSVIANVVGSFQSEIGCSGDWQPQCLRSWLQDPDGNGVYTFVTDQIPVGDYEAKAAHDQSWDENYGDGGEPNGANIPFSVPVGGTVLFSYDPNDHILTVEVEPDTMPAINEFSASTTGTDVEYVEIFGQANADFSDLTILEIEGDGSSAGLVDEVIAVGTTDASGFWLVSLAPNSLENGTLTLLLVQGFTGALDDDLDTNDDGTLETTPWSSLLDSVSVSDGGASDWTYSPAVLGPNYDGLSPFAPGGASRIPDGFDTDSASDWVRNDFDLAGISGYPGTPELGEAYNTPGDPNLLVPPPPETGSLQVTKVVDWSGTTPDTGQTFEICINGPTYPSEPSCVELGDGQSATWLELAPGEYTVFETDPGADWQVSGSGQVVVVGSGQTATATITNIFAVAPGIDIEKSTNGTDADTATGPEILVGESVTWVYVVTNTGNVPLDVTITDDQGAAVSCPLTTLVVGESMTCTATGTATAGQYANQGTATGVYTDPAGVVYPVTDVDDSHYFGADPSLSIDKTTSDGYGNEGDSIGVIPGETVTWQYYVTNTGNVPLQNVAVIDDQGAAVACPQDTLAVGECMTCTASGIASEGWYDNEGTASGDYADDVGNSITVSDTDDSSYCGLTPGIITNSSLCDFGEDFKLVFTPDIQNWPGHFKLSSSNPGQFYYNLFYIASGDTLNVDIPYPFVTQGANPVHVYSGVFVEDNGNGGVCFAPGNELMALSSQVTLDDFQDGYTTLVLEGLPDSGFVYVAIHLDYGLKGTHGWTKGTNDDALYDDAGFDPTYPRITNGTEYVFLADIADSEDSVQNVNTFKNLKGFGGLVLDGDGDGLEGEPVELRAGDGTLIETMVTDANGWYMAEYVHKGKTSEYTLMWNGQEITVTVGGKVKFGEGNFPLP